MKKLDKAKQILLTMCILFSLCIGVSYAEQSTFQDSLGNVYTGNFENGVLNGQGEMKYSAGSRYVGNFLNGKPDGKGIYYYVDGSRYEGDFKEGMKHGTGIYYDADGTKYYVEAQYDAWVKKEKISDNTTTISSQKGSDSTANINSQVQFQLNNGEGLSLQKKCAVLASDASIDFYIKDGKIICSNSSKINSIPVKDVNDETIKQALLESNLKESVEASKDLVYVMVTPRGYFGIFMFIDIDSSKNIYKGLFDSMQMDNIVKMMIEEQAKNDSTSSTQNGMDTIETGGMDTITTGGMDSISLGGMDSFELGDYDYFDTENYTDLTNVIIEGQKKQFKIAPRLYDNNEILIPLKDIQQAMGLSVTYGKDNGVEKATIKVGSNEVVVEAYSDTASIGDKKIKLSKAPKMDKDGIMVPVSFLTKTFGLHFSLNKDKKSLAVSKKAIVDWRYSAYESKAPYREYENKYIDGVKSKVTRYNGKKHVFKTVTLYNKKTGKSMKVAENKVKNYSKDWSTNPKTSKSSGGKSSSMDAFWTRYRTQQFFQSSSFNTWGGNIIRSLVP